MKRKPAAFMSYNHIDDKYGRLTEFRERLSHEVQMLTGEEFPIFQDRQDILWGQNWKERIEESLDEVTFLIPIITPGFFKSQPCRDELQRFIEREKKLERNDLILPVYYVDCPLLNDEAKRATDELPQVIAERQYADWRELRFEPFTSPQVGKTLAQLAVQIRDALERVQASPKTVVPGPVPDAAQRPDREPSPLRIQVAEHIQISESEKVIRGPSAKTEPPICVVDPMHRGDHLTITEAIEAANPGDRIFVRPGLYQEGLVMDKPLEIIGEGDLGEVVVQATEKDTLSFMTTMGRVANLTLRQIGGEDCYSVDIAQGRLELEDCDITSQSLACVAIHDGADPRLRRNHIHDSKASGVMVYENGQGTLEDNDIFDNDNNGVAIKSGNPTLRHNRIHDSKASGVMVYENGQGTLEDNDIFGSALNGVWIGIGGNPTLRRNRIYDNKQNGVLALGKGQGTLEDNEIFGNAHSGVVISAGGNPTLRRNRVYAGKQSGIYVYDGGQGVLEDNEIFGNAHSGVVVSAGGSPMLRHNRIHDNRENGVYVYENGQGTLEDNDILSNALAGVKITTGGNPTLRQNRINKNGSVAVQVYGGGAGTIEYNNLSGNAQGMWDVSADSESNLARACNYIDVIIVDPNGREYEAEVDWGTDMQTLLSALAEMLSLPLTTEDGRAIDEYSLDLLISDTRIPIAKVGKVGPPPILLIRPQV